PFTTLFRSRPGLPARDPCRPDPRLELRRREANQVRKAGPRRRPLALPSPLREHRLLATPDGPLPLWLDDLPRRARARAAVRSLFGQPRAPPPRLEPRDGRIRDSGAARERLPRARARNPQAEALPPVPAAPRQDAGG